MRRHALAGLGLVTLLATLVILLTGVPLPAEEGAGNAPPPLKTEEFNKAKFIYFDKCAGCHGILRKGATGPELGAAKMQKLGLEYVQNIVSKGTPQGMPGWGAQGILTPEDIGVMAKYLSQEPPQPDMLNMEEIVKTWQVMIPEEKRPTKPEHTRNWENFIGVILRDAGKVAIMDGDTKELVNIIDTGYAVHILRSSASGRYFYSIGRDAKVTLIDLWMSPPQAVAQVKVGNDARSIELSKYHGPLGDFRDKYAVIGCYWPPHFIILDGKTLKPLRMVGTSGYSYDDNEFIKESRVAAIVASHHQPQWMVCLKEVGQVWLVDYTDIDALKITYVAAERFLHDGGWDSTQRYFLVAANMRDKVCVVDAKEGKLVAKVEVGVKPHPGRGANFIDPEFGPVWATCHLGSPTISLIGTDPEKHPDHAWKEVRTLNTLSGGSLFIKTHPKSRHLWVDHTLNSDPKIAQTVVVYDLKNLDAAPKQIRVIDRGRVTHIEYDATGKEVWISGWDAKGELVIYDDETLQEKKRITGDWLITPTGKFNVTNTRQDIY